MKELNIILKADVQGSIEPIKTSLEQIPQEGVKVTVIHSGAGNVTESDVMLAIASKGVIVGFNTGSEPGARRMAEVEGVSIRYYNVIYNLIDDVNKALQGMLEPTMVEVIEGRADYSKANRLFTGEAYKKIPKIRYFGNAFLSLLTKIASGYWHIADSQSGYAAINREALNTINWDIMYKKYGQPNDLLVRLNVYNFRVCDVPVKPVYNIGEESGVRPLRMIPKLSWLLFKLFIYRMVQKYVIRDFHPLLFFYLMGVTLFIPGLLFGLYLVLYRLFIGTVAPTSALFAVFLFVSGLQSIFFAMWFDMDYNKRLR